ncbi:hypothetical protein KC19_8G143200 [Ceratodon purpureus]|uniref:Uncharacterized protein n=1 Tax=Ceratodon purpureus TaxID=3225 RepID=A0A8T0H404_CERPU|nr:hypothetical protein KC19_8G143200 [Ceratodon purpureus]
MKCSIPPLQYVRLLKITVCVGDPMTWCLKFKVLAFGNDRSVASWTQIKDFLGVAGTKEDPVMVSGRLISEAPTGDMAAAVDWLVGALIYCFHHLKGRRIMAHPSAVVYPRVSSCLPI